MDATVFSAVIFAAALHATWNALVKSSSDKYLSMTAVVMGHAPLALLAFIWVDLPPWSSWPWVIGSASLHVGYQMFLMWSYRAGDMSQVYPIARGTAPIIVAIVSVTMLGEILTKPQWAGIAAIAAGILSLLFVRGRDGLRNPNAAVLALVTSFFVACYTLADAYGARVSGTPIGYYSVATLLNTVVFAAAMTWAQPGILGRIRTEALKPALIGGPASYVAYAIAVWAFARAPIPLVAALRETSIVFALLISVIWMKERLDLSKLTATFVTTFGAVVLRFAR
jgi:drug/metabolite transporter (DMT)-like permease